MKKIVFIIPLIVLMSCTNKDHHKVHNHASNGQHHSKHGTANEHMKQSSAEELIERFESPERNVYQKPDKVLQYLGDIELKPL